jgi:hypothetical protein
MHFRRFRVRKEIVSFVLSVHMEQLGSHRTNFHEILYTWIFRKSVGKTQVSLQSDNKKGTLQEDQYTFIIICHSVILTMKYVSGKFRRENQNAHFLFNHFSFFFENRAVYEVMWKSTAGHRRQYGACTLHAIYLGLQIHTQTIYYLLLFTATIVALIHLTVTLYVHSLSCCSWGEHLILENRELRTREK